MKKKLPVLFNREIILELYQRLMNAYGPQYWWPADSDFEVMVGAVLTQNTAWKNVERAIANLKHENKICIEEVIKLPDTALAELIRPSGYFNVKTRRLKNLCHWVQSVGGIDKLYEMGTIEFRDNLLAVNGVGPETADDILLYAFNRPVFVIDTYTRRLFSSLGLIKGDEPYESLQNKFEACLDSDYQLFNEYHALIVRHAKQKCNSTNECDHCLVERPFI